MCFSKMYIFGAPIESGGAWYGIFLIREKPALRAGLITNIMKNTTGLCSYDHNHEENFLFRL